MVFIADAEYPTMCTGMSEVWITIWRPLPVRMFHVQWLLTDIPVQSSHTGNFSSSNRITANCPLIVLNISIKISRIQSQGLLLIIHFMSWGLKLWTVKFSILLLLNICDYLGPEGKIMGTGDFIMRKFRACTIHPVY